MSERRTTCRQIAMQRTRHNTPRPPAARRRAGATPHPAPARAERLPRRRRPGGREGRSLPGPGVLLPPTATPRAPTAALVPWICDVLLSNHSVKAYGRDLMDFVRHMQAQGVDPLAGHGRPREVLQAGAPGSRPEVRHGGTAALGPPRHLPAACRQGAHRLGDGPGHRRRQGPRRPEELDAVFDRAAGHFAFGGDSDRDLAGDPRPGADERLLHHRLPGLGDRSCLRRAPRDRRGRALSPRHREAEQEAAQDPARCRAAGPGLSRARGHRRG